MKINFSAGLNENDGTKDNECQSGQNFDLYIGDKKLRPRKPLDLKFSALSDPINGIMQLIKKDETETTIIFEANAITPKIHQWDGITTTLKKSTGLSSLSKFRDTLWPLDEYIVITDLNKKTPLLKWDGVNCNRLKTGISATTSSQLVSIIRLGSLATVTYQGSHGLITGDIQFFSGADQSDYNIEAEITVLTPTTLTYIVTGAPITPATGTLIATVATDIFAKYAVRHQGRLWFFNVKSDLIDSPHLIAVSEFENPENLDTSTRAGDLGFVTGLEPFYLLTKDLKAVNGAVVFMDRLIISTEKGQIFELTGSDSKDYAWKEFYQGSAATGTEAIVNIGNDVIFIRQGGNIELLSSTFSFGDVRGDDVSRWIPDTVRDIQEAQIIYDESNQKILFFIEGKVLVLFKDLLNGTEDSPWSVYITSLAFNFNIGSAKYLKRPGENTWSVYVGDEFGNIHDINGVGLGDSGTDTITTIRKNQIIELDPEKGFNPKLNPLVGRVQYRQKQAVTLTLDFDWTDEFNNSQAVIPLLGVPATDTAPYYNLATYYGTTEYYSQIPVYLDKVASNGFSPTGKGLSFFMEMTLDTDVDFQIDSITLGA